MTLATLDRAVVRARDAARPRPTVRLFSPYESNDTARRILRALRAKRPAVTIERLHGGSRAALEALRTGRVDAAVSGAVELPDGIAAEPVQTAPQRGGPHPDRAHVGDLHPADGVDRRRRLPRARPLTG